MTVNLRNRHLIIAGIVVAVLVLGVWALTRDNRDPDWLRKQYGITNAFSRQVQTPEGKIIDASLVPITLADGRTAFLVVPKNGDQIYLKDQDGLAPVESTDQQVSRDQFVRSQPVIVEKAVTRAPRAAAIEPTKKRSTKKSVLIVAGSAGTGAAIGGIAGGKKGAAIGAISGGVAGLVYDMATRNK